MVPCLATLVVDFSEVTSEVLNTLLLFLYFNFLSSLKFIDLFNFDVICCHNTSCNSWEHPKWTLLPVFFHISAWIIVTTCFVVWLYKRPQRRMIGRGLPAFFARTSANRGRFPMWAPGGNAPWFIGLFRRGTYAKTLKLKLHLFDLLWICCTTSCTTKSTTNPQQIE